MSRIILKPRDFQKLNGVKRSQAYKLYQHLKDVLGKKHPSISDYAKYYEVDIIEVKRSLGID